MLMAGADVTMLCSAVLRHGFPQIALVESELTQWLEEHDYESVKQIKGSLSQKNCPEPAAFERAQYMKALCTYSV
jgi:dihydroorotate dehydrogenase (fumarate)